VGERFGTARRVRQVAGRVGVSGASWSRGVGRWTGDGDSGWAPAFAASGGGVRRVECGVRAGERAAKEEETMNHPIAVVGGGGDERRTLRPWRRQKR
jgi:hypothetical protein